MSFSSVFLLILWKYCTLYLPALFKQTPNQSVLCEKERCESKILSEQDLLSLWLSSYCSVFRLTVICFKLFGLADRVAFIRRRVVRVGILFLWITWRVCEDSMFAAILKNARTVHGPQTAGSLTEKQRWVGGGGGGHKFQLLSIYAAK